MSELTHQVKIHDQGEGDLDAILRLIALADQNRPLESVLNQMCAEMAAVSGSDVASVYVRGARRGTKEVLTMRGNVGFPPDAVGSVTLKVGEGITGFVAQCKTPVSVAVAEHDRHFKPVAGLGEERFPSFLGIPLLRAGATVAVLVLQRRRPSAYSPTEVALATALAAPFAFALERHHQRQRVAAAAPVESSRTAHLRGLSTLPGQAMGRATFAATLEALQRSHGTRDHSMEHAQGVAAVEATWKRLGSALERVRQRVRRQMRPPMRLTVRRGDPHRDVAPHLDESLTGLALILEDARLRARIVEEVQTNGLLTGLCRVARAYARAAQETASAGADDLLAERAREVEDLCVLLFAEAQESMGAPNGPAHRSGAVVISPRLGGFLALAAVAQKVQAFVIGGPVHPKSAGLALAQAADLPVLSQVEGLFPCVRPQDLLVVDASDGQLHVNPPSSEVARFRSRRRDREPTRRAA